MCAGHRAVVCPLIDHYATRTAQRLSGGSPFLESLYGRSAPVLLAAGRAVITPIPSMLVRAGCFANVEYRNWSIILECDV